MEAINYMTLRGQEIFMKMIGGYAVVNEYGVRKVTRYVVTHFTSQHKVGTNENSEQASSVIGEFDNLKQAEIVAEALSKSDEGSTFYTVPRNDK